MKKRVAIYVRVSTTSQDTDSQEGELTEFAQRRNWTYSVFRDEGQSGCRESRPGLDALLNEVRRRKVDVVLVWALDRLARSLRQLLNLADEFRQLGVDLVVYKQGLDSTTPHGTLLYQVLGAVAEWEREMLRERVRAGIAQARRNGKKIGRPARRRFSSAEMEQIRAMRQNGASVRRMAIQFGATQSMIAKIVAGSGAQNEKVL